MAHPLAVAGLTLNTIGALLVLFFPPAVRVETKDGSQVGGLKNSPAPEGQHRYRIQSRGFRSAVILVAAGFLLQLLELLVA
jgi:hypothetical protein